MELKIDPAQVEKMLAQMVLESGLAKHLDAAVQRQLGKLSGTWDNPLDKVVEQEIFSIAREVFRESIRETLKEKVKEALNKKIEGDLADKIISKVLSDFDY